MHTGAPSRWSFPSNIRGRVLSATDDDWPALIQNLTKARVDWRKMTRIPSREGARPRVSGLFFKADIHSVLLLEADMWVVTSNTGLILGGF